MFTFCSEIEDIPRCKKPNKPYYFLIKRNI